MTTTTPHDCRPWNNPAIQIKPFLSGLNRSKSRLDISGKIARGAISAFANTIISPAMRISLIANRVNRIKNVFGIAIDLIKNPTIGVVLLIASVVAPFIIKSSKSEEEIPSIDDSAPSNQLQEHLKLLEVGIQSKSPDQNASLNNTIRVISQIEKNHPSEQIKSLANSLITCLSYLKGTLGRNPIDRYEKFKKELASISRQITVLKEPVSDEQEFLVDLANDMIINELIVKNSVHYNFILNPIFLRDEIEKIRDVSKSKIGPKTSIRSLKDRCYLLNSGKILGSGRDKVAKQAYKIQLVKSDALQLEKVAYVKDRKDRPVVAQIINPVLEGFSHPNVDVIRTEDKIPLTQKFPEHSRYGFITEQAIGDLSKLPITITAKVRFKLALDLLSGMSALHAQGICHQDFKLNNCFFYRDQNELKAKVADLQDAQREGEKSHMGKYPFAPLEDKGQLSVNKSYDIFLIGLSLSLLFKPVIKEIRLKPQIRGVERILADMQDSDPTKRPTLEQVLPYFKTALKSL